MKEIRVCKYDGNQFETDDKRKVFCTKNCSSMWRYYNTPDGKERSKKNTIRYRSENLEAWKKYYKEWYLKNKDKHIKNVNRRKIELKNKKII